MVESLVRESNTRLQTAREAQVSLSDLSIGDDCLPTWPEMHWDPAVETLHVAIQNRLLDLEIAESFGDMVQRDIITKTNRKLDEARSLGLSISDICVGEDLLPTWHTFSTDASEADVAMNGDTDATSPEEDEDSDPDTDGSPYAMSEGEMERDFRLDMLVNTPSHLENSDYDRGSDYDGGIDRGSWPRWDWGRAPETQGSDTSAASTLLDERWTSAGDTRAVHQAYNSWNTFHDASLVHSNGEQDVDMEVFVAHNDEDLADLPEVELAVDREAFEHYFDSAGAVDVELPGVDVRCTDNLGRADSIERDEDEDDCMEGSVSSTQTVPSPTRGNTSSATPGEDESDISEEATSEEGSDD